MTGITRFFSIMYLWDLSFFINVCMDGNEKVGNMIVMGGGVFRAVGTAMVM